MKLHRLSVCHHPTSVVFIDDNKTFLRTLQMELARYLPSHFYTSPQRALQFLNDEYHPSVFVDRCRASEIEERADQLIIGIDTRKIHQEIYNAKRFAEIGVLVVDYGMLGMNGLQLCEQLKHAGIKKIILTGEGDHSLATRAFNAGLIDQFIMKSAPDLTSLLKESIDEQMHKYSLGVSDLVINQLISAPRHNLHCLHDPKFVQFVEQLIQQHHIVEYYLLDAQGSLLLLNKDAKASILIVKNAEEMQNLFNFARFENAPNEVLDALKNRSAIPYFHTDKDLYAAPQQWIQYFHPAKELHGREKYFYSFLENPQQYPLDLNEVISFQKYLQKTAMEIV